MWCTVAGMEQLRARRRWTAEAFADEAAGPGAAFPLVALREVASERREVVTPAERPDEIVRYVGLENVASLTGDLVGFAPRRGGEIRSPSKVFRRGDVLYGRLRPYLNKVHCAGEPCPEGVCSGEFHVLIPRLDRARPVVLRALLASRFVLTRACGLQTGAALPRVPLADLLELRVPLPPLEEQVRLERFLVAEDDRRRRLAAEVAALPARIDGALTRFLETGQPPGR